MSLSEIVVWTPCELRVILPVDGRTAVVAARELTGRDHEQADLYRMSTGGGMFAFFHALLARVTTLVDERTQALGTPAVEPKQLVPEDLQDMSTRDIGAIQKALRDAKDERFFPNGIPVGAA